MNVLIDIAKGFVAVVVFCEIVGVEYAQYGVFFVFLGHVFPVCLGFSGGNGMGVLLGSLSALHPMIGLIALSSWLFAYYVYRYQTLAAVLATVTTPLVVSLLPLEMEVSLLLVIAVILFVRQVECLRRLMRGDEYIVAWA